MRKMNRVEAFFLKDRIGSGSSPRMSVAEVGFVLLAIYELVRLVIWLKS